MPNACGALTLTNIGHRPEGLSKSYSTKGGSRAANSQQFLPADTLNGGHS